MESRLPKPTPFRPIAGLAADKNKSTATGGGTAYVPPLTRDMSNSRNFLARPRVRATSPEPPKPNNRSNMRRSRSAFDLNHLRQTVTNRHRVRAPSPEPPKTSNRSNMRRSRSACDLNNLRQAGTKRTALPPTLPSVPSKLSRTTATTVTKTSTLPTLPSVPNKLSRTAATTSTVAAARPGRPPILASRKPPASAPAAKTGGRGGALSSAAAAPAKIAPYDFKARFYNLLEKYKTMKSNYDKQVDDLVELESIKMQLEETLKKLIETETKLRNAESSNESLIQQCEQQTEEINTMKDTLGRINSELTDMRAQHQKTLKENHSLSAENVELRQRSEDLQLRNEEATKEIKTLQEQLFKSNMDRKVLHNNVLDLKGNIRVFCRVRPPLQSEIERRSCFWNFIDEATVEIQSTDVQQAKQTFTFDQVFHPNSEQEDIFDMVSPLIQSALDGYNICIFAYGQTGSGKTYTMDGVPNSLGVIPRTVDLLFGSISSYKNMGWEYEIKATFLEIYNETLYDLLSNEPKDLEIRMAKNNKNDIYVSNITEEYVRDPNHLRKLMETAKMNRATACTVGNERSSRSHAVTKLQLIGRHAVKQEVSIGSINLVDLAGSESPKTSTRMTETKNINRSLSELTNCILALLQKQDHIPYRNSKLTHLLMPALGGNSKTLMFINVSPFQDCYQESVKSLRFATSVNSCKMNKAKRVRQLNSNNNSKIENS